MQLAPKSRILNRKAKANELLDRFRPGDASPSDAYKGLVSMSSTRFRADVEFHEEPRQVTFAVLLIVLVLCISMSNSSNHTDAAMSFKLAILGGFAGLVIYIMLQSKDGLMIRPHPMLWRAIHGMTLGYYCLLVILVVLPPNFGIQLFHDIFPDANGGSAAVFEKLTALPTFPGQLDCQINYETIRRQFISIWFLAHVIGFWMKMCLYRDWSICITYSITFEVAELLLGWMIPEFQECWWDSIFMDVLGANLIGMYLGHLTLKWLSCRDYVWESKKAGGSALSKFGHLLKRFTPFSWSTYVWQKDSNYSWLPSIGWISALFIELNSFVLIHALHINPAHWTNPARQLLLGAQGAQAVPEWYEYVRGNTPRIGHNCWLLYTIAALEIVLGMRYGKGGRSYGPLIVPDDIVMILTSCLVLWSLWMAITTYRDRLGEQGTPKWLFHLRFLSFTPLVFLARRWAY